jgi:hypothetical protein
VQANKAAAWGSYDFRGCTIYKPGFIFFFQMKTVLGTKLDVVVYTTTAVASTVK